MFRVPRNFKLTSCLCKSTFSEANVSFSFSRPQKRLHLHQSQHDEGRKTTHPGARISRLMLFWASDLHGSQTATISCFFWLFSQYYSEMAPSLFLNGGEGDS